MTKIFIFSYADDSIYAVANVADYLPCSVKIVYANVHEYVVVIECDDLDVWKVINKFLEPFIKNT